MPFHWTHLGLAIVPAAKPIVQQIKGIVLTHGELDPRASLILKARRKS